MPRPKTTMVELSKDKAEKKEVHINMKQQDYFAAVHPIISTRAKGFAVAHKEIVQQFIDQANKFGIEKHVASLKKAFHLGENDKVKSLKDFIETLEKIAKQQAKSRKAKASTPKATKKASSKTAKTPKVKATESKLSKERKRANTEQTTKKSMTLDQIREQVALYNAINKHFGSTISIVLNEIKH